MYVGCGVGSPGLVGRRLSSASVVRLKSYRSHVVYKRHLCVVPARLKNDLLHALPAYGVKTRHLSGGFGNRSSRRECTVGVCMMYKRTYCIVCTATLVVSSARTGILKYVNKPKVGDKDELELSETVLRAPPSTVQAKKKQDAEVSGEMSGNRVG